MRRLYAERGLARIPLRDGPTAKARLRWQAERPGALWHGDVCHGPSLLVGGSTRPLRFHALLDDASRYIVALEAHHTEMETDMLGLLVRATRRHGAPDALYLDNGATYRGDILSTACARLGVSLMHARPYDPQARGKMERFWRTLREGCLDFLGQVASLHDVNVRLWAFLDQNHHVAAHASLLGRSPAKVYEAAERPADPVDETMLRNALTVRVRRRVRRDSTLPLDGADWETDQGFLAGRLVTVARCLVESSEPPCIEHEGKRLLLRIVDPVRNARRKRAAHYRRRLRSAQGPPRSSHRPRASSPHQRRGDLLMSAAYLADFDLRQAPFSKEISDADLWLPPSKQTLVEELVQALDERASITLTGEPGVGKTCVLRALRHKLPSAGFRLTYCHNATLGRRDFYRQLCLALGLPTSASATAVFFAVSSHVEDLGRDRLHPVFLLDEAHLLHQDMLDHLHILLKYQWDSRALLSVVLVGLPELDDRLALRRNHSLYSRLHRRLTIDGLAPGDTGEYLRMRLAKAGCDRDPFTSDATAMIHEAALGSLREIDRVATAALREGARRKRKLVERDAVARVVAVTRDD